MFRFIFILNSWISLNTAERLNTFDFLNISPLTSNYNCCRNYTEVLHTNLVSLLQVLWFILFCQLCFIFHTVIVLFQNLLFASYKKEPSDKPTKEWRFTPVALCVQDEDPETSWLLLCEEDLISLLNQFPFQQLYSHMLGMSKQGKEVPLCCASCVSVITWADAQLCFQVCTSPRPAPVRRWCASLPLLHRWSKSSPLVYKRTTEHATGSSSNE